MNTHKYLFKKLFKDDSDFNFREMAATNDDKCFETLKKTLEWSMIIDTSSGEKEILLSNNLMDLLESSVDLVED